MTLFILTETSAGYALLKAKDKKLLKRDDLEQETSSAEGVCGLLKLKQFKKFESASSALEEAAALTEGKVRSCNTCFALSSMSGCIRTVSCWRVWCDSTRGSS